MNTDKIELEAWKEAVKCLPLYWVEVLENNVADRVARTIMEMGMEE
jgi:predicted nucleic acid binding AN1-type Zn finger protein|tara:strand:- start:3 stop:140 length:138 start_codon:yes stop_codon:yes gene_type:complete